MLQVLRKEVWHWKDALSWKESILPTLGRVWSRVVKSASKACRNFGEESRVSDEMSHSKIFAQTAGARDKSRSPSWSSFFRDGGSRWGGKRF